MKKIVSICVVLILLISFVWAANSNQAVKRVQWNREMTAKFTTVEKSDVKLAARQIKSSQFNERAVQQIQRSHALQTGSSDKGSKIVNLFKSESFGKSGFSMQSTAGVDTLVIDPDGIPDTISYVVGDEIFLFINTGTDTAIVNFLVDDGDGVYNPGNELLMDDKEMIDIKLWDGVEFDQSPAGDGMFMATINTSALGDGPGPIMAIQNAIVFLDVAWINSMATNYGMMNIGAPDENTSISGSVTAEDGSGMRMPAVNIIVVAVMPGSDEGSQIGFLTKTDVNGQYRIEIPDVYQGHYQVFAQDVWQFYPGMLPEPPSYDLDVWGDIPGVSFRLTIGSELINGYVKDESGAGVADIPVFAEGMSQHIESVSDASGYYEIRVNPGWWWVNIQADYIHGQYMLDYGQNLDVSSGGDHPADFTLYTLDSGFEGQASLSDATPVADVEVHADIWMGDHGYYNYTNTNADGDYFVGVSTALQGQVVDDEFGGWPTFYWLSACYEDAIVMPGGYGNLLAPQSGLDFTIIMPDASLSGTVYNANDNTILCDAQIHAFFDDNNGNHLDYWAFSDENGHYEVPLVGGVPPNGNPWMVEVFWPNEPVPSLIDSLIVLSGNNLTKDYYIKPPVKDGFIEGYVFDKDGNGIQNARVEIYGPDYYEVYTDNRGYFSVNQIPFGWYSCTAYAEGYDPYDIWDIWVGSDPVYLEFWMGSIVGNITVNGHIRDNQAAPILNAILMAYNWSYNEPFTLFTDSTGYYELKVKPDNYDFQVGANGFLAQRLSINIMADTTMDFTLASAGSIADTLAGNVIDDSGNKLRKVFVYLESDAYIGFTYTNLDGHYKVALPAGTYNASYSKRDFNTEWRGFNWPSEQPEDPIVLFPYSHVVGPMITSVIDVPEDNGKQVRLTWKRAEGLVGAVEEYQIWRAIQRFDGADPNSGTNYDWDYVMTVPVNAQMDLYNVVVPTLYDKVGTEIYWTGFMICAISWDGWTFWNSNILAGWSEDNLPPTVPASLAAAMAEKSVTLSWEAVTSEKIKYYTVYRQVNEGSLEKLNYTTDTEYLDDSIVRTNSYTYTVTATDFGLNESGQAEPVVVPKSTVSGVEEAELPTEFALKSNYPNPFNPETTIEFALPEVSKVNLKIYNLTGQLVRELVSSEYPAGYQKVIWDGRDAYGNNVGSGVYIYALKACSFSQTRKMILIR
jgi:hypothetical protein